MGKNLLSECVLRGCEGQWRRHTLTWPMAIFLISMPPRIYLILPLHPCIHHVCTHLNDSHRLLLST